MLKKVQNVNRFTESLDKTFPLISILKSSSTVLVVIRSIITSDFHEVNYLHKNGKVTEEIFIISN